MFVNVNEKAQSKFSAQVERRHNKFTEKRPKAKSQEGMYKPRQKAQGIYKPRRQG